jgi:alkanesulfonate monooxygenase SsuD/methylene tetrahydromethanopterin reductase-like flavin-dependent oxidoreductase (luciferase family)
VLILRYDLRVPTHLGADAATQYAACLEQVRWGDRIGLDMVVLSEHHGVEDGFLPSPVTMAAALGAATTRIPISISALLITMHDPVRLAEQLATADLVSGGRVSAILGTGYREEEFEMAGIAFRDRNRILDEYLGVLRQAWTGEYFEWQGRRVRVRPTPKTPGGPFLLLGGSSESSARKAARMGMFFSPADSDGAVIAAYNDECATVGFAGFAMAPPKSLAGFVHVSDDPERDWPKIFPYALHEAQTYESWQRPGQTSAVQVHGASTLGDIKASGIYRVVTPDECVEMYQSVGALILHPLMGGIPPELAQESLSLFESAVLPRLRPNHP